MAQDKKDFELDVEEIESRISGLAEDAIRWWESEVEPEQEENTKYYKGDKFGNEEEGRSQVVMTTVRDTVRAILPSLLRIFFNPERPVEFEPRFKSFPPGTPIEEIEAANRQAEAIARQKTDYISFIVAQDNPGFQITLATFKDALIRKEGIVKWWWDDSDTVEAEEFSGLSEEQVIRLLAEPDVDVEVNGFQEDETQPGKLLFDVSAVRRVEGSEGGRARFAAVPNEEFFVSPSAGADLDEAEFVMHQRAIPASDAVAMGIDPEQVENHKGQIGLAHRKDASSLPASRRIDRGAFLEDAFKGTESQERVLLSEVWLLIDLDGDGISERRLFTCIGESYEIAMTPEGALMNQIVSEVPFATFGPDPESHERIGLAVADHVKDLQRIQSDIARGMLDSLAQHLDPEREVVEGMVNMSDVLNTERSKIIRVRQPNQMREVVTPFVGQEALTVMQFFETIKENRTGISKAAAGLDADALQSATKAAVAATLSGAQQHIEMIARIFAETGWTRLMRGLLRLVLRHQNRPRLLRLRGQIIEMDPRYWDASMDVRINVALGQGTPEDKLSVLSMIGEKQQQLLEMGSPLVSNVELRNTLGRMVEIAGFANSAEFFKIWGPEQEAAHQHMLAQQPPPRDLQAELVDVEKARVEAEIARDQERGALDRQKMILDDDRKRDELAQKSALEELRIEKKHKADIEDIKVKEKIAARRKDASSGGV